MRATIVGVRQDLLSIENYPKSFVYIHYFVKEI